MQIDLSGETFESKKEANSENVIPEAQKTSVTTGDITNPSALPDYEYCEEAEKAMKREKALKGEEHLNGSPSDHESDSEGVVIENKSGDHLEYHKP